jgi:hypothetical protein
MQSKNTAPYIDTCIEATRCRSNTRIHDGNHSVQFCNSCIHLPRDRVPVVLLAEWNLTCEMFDGEVISGPVPTLLSDRPEAAKAALVNDPEKAFMDLRKILRKLVIHEYVLPSAAWGIVLKPR